MSNVKQRIQRLEQEAGASGDGQTVVFHKNDWRIEQTPEQEAHALAEVKAAMGPGDNLLVIEYVPNWRSDDDGEQLAATG